MRRILVFHLFLLIISNSVDSAVIRGKIRDRETGVELIGSQVYVKELKRGSVSGLDGSYIIKNVPGGSYHISCSYIGYQTVEMQITVDDADAKIFDLNLEE